MNITEHTKAMIGDLVLTIARQAAEIDALREQAQARAEVDKAVQAMQQPPARPTPAPLAAVQAKKRSRG